MVKIKKEASTMNGLSKGITFAILIFVVSFLSKWFGIFTGFTQIFAVLFGEFGYDLNLFGILLGTIYAFVTGFVVGRLHAFIYRSMR